MFSDLESLASILDEHIVKALAKPTKIQRLERDIIKGLSHDPFNPVLMTEDVGYYNPYRQMADGSFVPFPVEHWEEQGHRPEHYLTTKQFYEKYMPPTAARQKFDSFARSIENDLYKAGAVPIGTVHTYRDGGKYKKVGEGKWAPVEGQSDRMKTWLSHPNPEYKRQANQEIEDHGTKVTALESMMKRRQGEAKTMDEFKQKIQTELMGKVKEAMAKLYDGKMPKEMDEHFDKISGKGEEKVNPKQALKDLEQHVGGKPKHHVTLKFLHNGKKYEHTFQNVDGAGHHDAINTVTEGLKKKLKGAQLLGANAVTAKDEPGKAGAAQPKEQPKRRLQVSNG